MVGIKEKYRDRPPLPADWPERLDRLAPVLARHDIRLAYLFGSAVDRHHADQHQQAPADIDLAYLPGKGFRFRPFYADVSEVLDTDRLDLVDLRLAAPGVLYEIIRCGRVIYRDRVETENTFEHSVLARFREEALRLSRWVSLAQP